MFKCKDAAGKITYSSEDCAKIGLDPAGAVKDRVIVQETRKPRPLPPMQRDLAEPPPRESAAAEGSASPSGRCVIIKTPLGTRTHCADMPAGID